MRKLLGMVLTLCMVIGLLSSVPFSACAATTTVVTQNEAVSWLYSKVGTSVSTPYGYAGQCASLAYRYYEKILGYPAYADGGGTGNGNDYDDNNHSVNLGWSRFNISASTTLNKGDVIVWNSGSPNSSNHVAIYISGSPASATVIESAPTKTSGITKETYRNNLVKCTCVRPAWKGTHTHSYKRWYEAVHPHRVYMKCSCGDYYYTGEYKTMSTCSECITPGTPTLKGIKSFYHNNDTVTFTWDSTVNTTHYNIYIHVLDDSGEYKGIENIFYAKSGLTRQLPTGKYRVLLQSTNANAWTDDGSTWRYTNGDWIYFEVGNCIFLSTD